ncbi:signal peptidase I [Rhodococcus sp. 105337]|uniref:signal peptidase I n=1 Tax=Rhodococcus sp. 105337 TaxID=2725310 RepID=UPI001469E6C6|nr:signal peptidase I [Rhodococcus sp. 105337]NME81082.1 signal peptidase I [Rhodococcus sp. 105337]
MTGNENFESDRQEGGRERGSGSGDTPSADAESTANKKKHRSFLRELPILVVVALALSFLLQTFLARVYLIPSESMEPTLHGCVGCTGDRIVVDKVTYRFGDPEPGDVVVFKGPPSWSTEYQSTQSDNVVVRGVETVASWVGLVPPDENDLVKRVIAIEGQTVQCLPEDPTVLVDGEPLDEPYIDRTLRGNDSACQGIFFGPVTVPQGHVWVMGDNRTNSKDSRFHLGDELQGTIPVSEIIGKVRLIILPPSRWGVVHAVNPQ